MDQPIDVDLRGKTIRQALDSILLHGNGYGWRLRNGIIEVTNSHASKRSEGLLNRVIPVFKISEGAASTVKMTSAMLWLNLQMELDPSLKEKGIGGDMPGNSPSVKPATLRNRTVREILSYIVLKYLWSRSCRPSPILLDDHEEMIEAVRRDLQRGLKKSRDGS